MLSAEIFAQHAMGGKYSFVRVISLWDVYIPLNMNNLLKMPVHVFWETEEKYSM